MFSAFNPSKCTHLEQWAADCAAPGEQSWTSCQSRDSNPQPWVTSGRVSSPTLYPLGQRLPPLGNVLTRSSLFCLLNTIYYSVSQLIGQKCWVCSPKVGCETVMSGSWIIYSQRNDINKKRNSKCFSDARLLF